jgi:hypothetical protein
MEAKKPYWNVRYPDGTEVQFPCKGNQDIEALVKEFGTWAQYDRQTSYGHVKVTIRALGQELAFYATLVEENGQHGR